ncbi:translation initiation factor eIF-2B subunit epsilon [Patella vulgata]|uniref:translation initiation factor eIF-2B subunit epsilon n=1 Tax=Patella vulgata TaxID=6465 RepID=UPI00217F362F|nr:translation initiation factor eIF-2B subunit epsilon [Patella vulgata]
MAPKTKTSQRGEDLKQEDVLQAVVIADSFNIRFGPLTQKKPRALLPLVNVPVIDYTLNFLAAAGIQEVFVVCCHLADQIRTHLKNSKWSEASSTMTVTPVLSDGCLSVGDALREIDSKALIRSDFILITGDVVSNIAVQDIMAIHKKRREKDKSSLMTMIYKKAPIGHSTRCPEDDVVLAVSTQSEQVLHYQKTRQEKRLDMPVEILLDNTDVEIRYDLMDCQISICTPLVPQLYTDNFDYQTREDFVKGILINEEILGNTIHLHVVKDEYAARVSNLQMYDAVSKDIIRRWTFPMVPDQNFISTDKQRISYGRHNIYLSENVSLERGCVLEENVVIGSNTVVGSNTFIIDSVIGKNCIIGENVKIKGGYLWDGVKVEDHCMIDTAVLASGVIVYKNTTVNTGSVLAWDVKVGPDIVLPQLVLLMSEPQKDEFDSDTEEPIPEVTPIFGSKSKAFEYRASCGSDDDEEDDGLIQDTWGLKILSDDEDYDDIYTTDSDDDLDVDDGVDEADIELGDVDEHDVVMFYSELIDTLKRAKEENIGKDNVILEINSLKHAYNICINDVHRMVVKAVIDLPLLISKDIEATQVINILKPQLAAQKPLLLNYIKSPEAQLDCLNALEGFSEENKLVKSALIKIIHYFYNEDMLDEQVIFKWYKKEPHPDNITSHTAVRKQVAPFIKWLQDAEEESSDD